VAPAEARRTGHALQNLKLQPHGMETFPIVPHMSIRERAIVTGHFSTLLIGMLNFRNIGRRYQGDVNVGVTMLVGVND
jgi:hypothetical protein